MKRGSTLFLKIVILLISFGALAALIRFPQTEGRAANLDMIDIYNDPFVIYMYIAFIPFFVALFQAFKLLGYIDRGKIFSKEAVKTVKNIKYCTLAFIGFIFLAITYIFINAKTTQDDPAGAIALGIFILFASSVIAATTDIFQKTLQKASKM